MNEKLQKIQEYLIKTGVSKEKVEAGATSSVYLAMEIMEYAHRNQKRENGEEYAMASIHNSKYLDQRKI